LITLEYAIRASIVADSTQRNWLFSAARTGKKANASTEMLATEAMRSNVSVNASGGKASAGR
jgi:hypothetical protein